MDTSRPAVAEIASGASPPGTITKRQLRTVEEKRRIVEETFVEGALVAWLSCCAHTLLRRRLPPELKRAFRMEEAKPGI